VREVFGIDSDLMVPAFAEREDHVPEIDAVYRFNPDVTLAILAGFTRNRRVMLQGLHGTGKSTHIEQVAARLNWPCVRVNLDGHISRLDLVGKDAIVLRDGLQVTEFQEGIVPWALQRPVALIFDEYDAGRPDVMFVIQRILERDGKFTLLDQNRVIRPHPSFRLFATSNTVGLGNLSGMYHGTQVLNHAQIDRWNIVATLNYLPPQEEVAIVLARVPGKDTTGPQADRLHGGAGGTDAQGLCRRRPVDPDVAAHRDHLGRELRDLPRPGAGLPPVLPQQVRRGRARRWSPSTTSAASASRTRRVVDARRGRHAARLMLGPAPGGPRRQQPAAATEDAKRNSAPRRCAR
jgi:MoxR-like ATPase